MKLHHVALTVKDLSISISFYSDFFGFKETKRFRRDDFGATGVFLQGDSCIFELWQFDIFAQGSNEEFSHTGIKHLAFESSDLENARNNFIAHNFACSEIQKGMSGGLYFFLSDPDGNQVEIYQVINE